MARLTGKNGAVYVKIAGTFTLVADVFDWEFHFNTTVQDISIKGDVIERWIPTHNSGVRFTAKRYNQGIGSSFALQVIDSAVNATQTEWRLDLIANNSSFLQITCRGYAIAASSNAPRGMSEETFELQIDDSFVYST